MQEVFHAYEKDTEVVTELSLISEEIAEKGKAFRSFVFLEKTCCGATKVVSVTLAIGE